MKTIDQIATHYHLNTQNELYLNELKKHIKTKNHPFEFLQKKTKQLGFSKMSASNLTSLYWECRGYSKEEAKEKISKIQGERTSIKKRIQKLISEGFSEEEATQKMKEWSQFKSKSVSDAHKRAQEKDPTYLKSMSHQCKEFWIKKGFSEEESIQKAAKVCERNRKKFREKLDSGEIEKGWNNCTIEFYLKKGMTIDEAKIAIIERQATFTLEKCISKYGEEEGRKRWIDRQNKWIKNYRKKSYSFISQELFWKLYEELSYKPEEIKFATFENGKRTENVTTNKEEKLFLDNRLVLPDFIHLLSKKIIEFDGVYYHRKNPENKKREQQRDKDLERNGYKVFHVNESEYKLNLEDTINKCKQFLNS